VIESGGAVEIDGRRYAWRSVGSGPPLVLLNGYSARAVDWDPNVLNGLASEFEVICPDHRGMGESDLGDAAVVTIDEMAADVEPLLDARGIERAPVAGWSMGGFIAQQLVRRAPGRVSALVVLGSDPGGSAAVRADPAAWAQLTDHSGTPREQATRLIPLLFPPALAPAIDQAMGDLIAEARATLSPAALEAQQRAMAAWHKTDQAAPDARDVPPVLVLHGTEDIVIPPPNAAELASTWPFCGVELFDGGGHAFFSLEPQRVADLVIDFCGD
jgi:pimeloyl-ACP methyl ester carboxylesterase